MMNIDNDLNEFAQKNDWNFIDSIESIDGVSLDNAMICLVPRWSNICLEKLECIKDRLNTLCDAVYVLDIDNFSTESQIEDALPGVCGIYCTPALIHYSNGTMVNLLQGDDLENLNSAS